MLRCAERARAEEAAAAPTATARLTCWRRRRPSETAPKNTDAGRRARGASRHRTEGLRQRRVPCRDTTTSALSLAWSVQERRGRRYARDVIDEDVCILFLIVKTLGSKSRHDVISVVST